MLKIFVFFTVIFFSGCNLAPKYSQPKIELPKEFKAAGANWQQTNTIDRQITSKWWQIFNDPILNNLQTELEKNNQDIIAASGNYKRSLAFIDKARVEYLPSIESSSGFAKIGKNGKSNYRTNTALNSSWEADLWGRIAGNIKSEKSLSKIAYHDLQAAKLSAQSSLAQYYYEITSIDKNQILLDKIIKLYEENLTYNQNRVNNGLSDEQSVIEAKQVLKNLQIQSLSNKQTRSQYQNAIAVLIGKNPSEFSLASNHKITIANIKFSLNVPSTLLIRRPDIQAAEAQVIYANEQIGVTKAAFFPVISLKASQSFEKEANRALLSLPSLIWSLGANLAMNITNLAAYKSANKAAKENYNIAVANYRQTILKAFEETENQLFNVTSQENQHKIELSKLQDSKNQLKILSEKYNLGVVDNSKVINGKISVYLSQIDANTSLAAKTSYTIALIKAIGGGLGNK